MSGMPKATTATMISCLGYRDADAAVDWLCRAFGMQQHAVYRDDTGKIVHAELSFGNGMIMIGPSNQGDFGKRFMTMPDKTGGRETQTVYVIVDDADAHHARAVAERAQIVMPLESKGYGGKSYAARDLEGHLWSFGTYDPWQVQGNA